MTSDGGPGNGLEKVSLTNLGTVRGGVPVQMDRAPNWNRRTWGPPVHPSEVEMEGFSGNAASPARGGATFTVTGTVANLSGPRAKSVSAMLDLPAGWTATPAASTTIGTLAPGASRSVSWTVTIPSDVAAGRLRRLRGCELSAGVEERDGRRLLPAERHPEGPDVHQRPPVRVGDQWIRCARA